MVDAPGISFEAVRFRIGAFTLNVGSLEVRRGEYFVLTGPNGSGKTMLMKLICGLHLPEEGRIGIDGTDVTELPPWRRAIGYVPQDGLLLPNRTVEGNLEFGLEVRGVGRQERREIARKMAEFLGVGDLLNRRPEGLSGGERQKACLGRALVLRPRVLLLDEPVSAIDETSRDALCGELRRIQRELGITTLHIAHNRQETAMVADRIGRMRAGSIEEVRDNPRKS